MSLFIVLDILNETESCGHHFLSTYLPSNRLQNDDFAYKSRISSVQESDAVAQMDQKKVWVGET